MKETGRGQLDDSAARRRFDRAAMHFDQADFVHRHTFDGLMQRLVPMNVEPRFVIDLGCAAGAGERTLAKRFRHASIIGLDRSLAMLRAGGRGGFFSRRRRICAEAARLPLANGSVDVVVANLLLPWLPDPAPAMTEINRVLRKDGLFQFASLGPASLSLLREAWSDVDGEPHVIPFADMHNLGDALISCGLRDPVLDVDSLVVSYRDHASLFSDLTSSGARNALAGRRCSLTGKHRFGEFKDALDRRRKDGLLEIELELVFGHAWGGGAQPSGGEFSISPQNIGRRS